MVYLFSKWGGSMKKKKKKVEPDRVPADVGKILGNVKVGWFKNFF